MDKLNAEMQDYIDRLAPELLRYFGSGFVTAHIESEPAVLSMNSDHDFSMVACDLVCDDPAATYDINIIVQDESDFDDVSTPKVRTLDDAKNLAMIIARQVNDFKVYPCPKNHS